MKQVLFGYGRGKIAGNFDENELLGVLTSNIESYKPEFEGRELVRNALQNPVGSEKLSELSKGKKKVVIIASDHTRPVPSKVIMPEMLGEIRKGTPDADITILIATGCHRGTTKDELVEKFGEEIVKNEKIYIHDCDERDMMTNIGKLPSGADCEINKLAIEADLLVAEGFIEPHLFAGFSGGRKSVLPGIASRETVMGNHCSEFIAHKNARTGILDGNPIHEDMLWAAENAKLKFIVNVVLNGEKKPIFAVAGDLKQAHKKGTDFISSLCAVNALPADIAITTNGGYPLDQNTYQAAKGMTAGEATVKEGGVIIMLSESADGTGGEHFYKQLADGTVDELMDKILSRDRRHTEPDQWQAQIILRAQQKATVIYVSMLDDKEVEGMHMIPAHSVDEAVVKAKEILKKDKVTIAAIPDGIAVVVKQ